MTTNEIIERDVMEDDDPSFPWLTAFEDVDELAYIYGLVDPRTPGLVMYVGKTVVPTHRLEGHLSAAKANKTRKVSAWVSTLNQEGIKPHMVCLAVCNRVSGQFAEDYFIQEWRAINPLLLNQIRAPRPASATSNHGKVMVRRAEYWRRKFEQERLARQIELRDQWERAKRGEILRDEFVFKAMSIDLVRYVLEQQSGQCPICGVALEAAGRLTWTWDFSVDGVVRGLVCLKCKNALTQLEGYDAFPIPRERLEETIYNLEIRILAMEEHGTKTSRNLLRTYCKRLAKLEEQLASYGMEAALKSYLQSHSQVDGEDNFSDVLRPSR